MAAEEVESWFAQLVEVADAKAILDDLGFLHGLEGAPCPLDLFDLEQEAAH